MSQLLHVSRGSARDPLGPPSRGHGSGELLVQPPPLRHHARLPVRKISHYRLRLGLLLGGEVEGAHHIRPELIGRHLFRARFHVDVPGARGMRWQVDGSGGAGGCKRMLLQHAHTSPEHVFTWRPALKHGCAVLAGAGQQCAWCIPISCTYVQM